MATTTADQAAAQAAACAFGMLAYRLALAAGATRVSAEGHRDLQFAWALAEVEQVVRRHRADPRGRTGLREQLRALLERIGDDLLGTTPPSALNRRVGDGRPITARGMREQYARDLSCALADPT